MESEEELLSVVVAVLSPQAATEAGVSAMPDRAAMERTRMFFCMIITNPSINYSRAAQHYQFNS